MTATTEPTFAPVPPEPERPAMSHREVLEAMSGLLLAMFVAILSSTVVSTALPRIIGDLGGSQSAYTWVVTSTLLALTARRRSGASSRTSSTASYSSRPASSSTWAGRSWPGSRSPRAS